MSRQEEVRQTQKKVKVVMCVKNTQYNVVQDVATLNFNFKLSFNPEQDFGNSSYSDIFWTDYQVPIDFYYKIKDYQKINFYPGIDQICNKGFLQKNIQLMQSRFPDDFCFFPKSWNLPQESKDFRKSMQDKKFYIMKPENMCQGQGISLISKFQEIEYVTYRYIIQEYIENPYLIDGLKWDLRLYVLLCGSDPLRILLYKEGMARFATVPYKKPSKYNQNNQYQHLTNYSVNKNNPEFFYNFDEKHTFLGHKRSYTAILTQLERSGKDVKKLQSDINKLIFKTIASTYTTLLKSKQRISPENFQDDQNYQILGFDIIIDSQMKPWLLEVNASPSFGVDTPFDCQLKSKLINDTINLMNVQNLKQKPVKQFYNSDKLFRRTRLKVNQIDQSVKQNEIQKRTQFIDANLGNFENIMIDSFYEKLAQYQDLSIQPQSLAQKTPVKINIQTKAQTQRKLFEKKPIGFQENQYIQTFYNQKQFSEPRNGQIQQECLGNNKLLLDNDTKRKSIFKKMLQMKDSYRIYQGFSVSSQQDEVESKKISFTKEVYKGNSMDMYNQTLSWFNRNNIINRNFELLKTQLDNNFKKQIKSQEIISDKLQNNRYKNIQPVYQQPEDKETLMKIKQLNLSSKNKKLEEKHQYLLNNCFFRVNPTLNNYQQQSKAYHELQQ